MPRLKPVIHQAQTVQRLRKQPSSDRRGNPTRPEADGKEPARALRGELQWSRPTQPLAAATPVPPLTGSSARLRSVDSTTVRKSKALDGKSPPHRTPPSACDRGARRTRSSASPFRSHRTRCPARADNTNERSCCQLRS